MNSKFGLLLPNSLNIEFDDSVILTGNKLTIYHNYYDYIHAFHMFKIAVMDQWIDQNQRYASDADKQLRKILINHSDKVIIHHKELDIMDVDYIKQIQSTTSKVLFSINGVIQDSINNLTSLEWIASTVNLYWQEGNLRAQLALLNPFSIKEKYFDFLPGLPRPHRLVVADYIKNFNLNDKILSAPMFAMRMDTQANIDYLDPLLWDQAITKVIGSSYNDITYNGLNIKSSQLVPIEIYNHTAYSIVTETAVDNCYNFYTEKIAKPMIASRLFIVFSGKNYLENLRKLGFKTFHGIIDESYDKIDNPTERWYAAFEQVKYLCSRPQEEILPQIAPIVLHNQRMIMSYDWIKNLKYYIEDLFLDEFIKSL